MHCLHRILWNVLWHKVHERSWLNLLESLRYVSSVWARKTQTVLDPVMLAVSAAQPGRAKIGSPAWTSWGEVTAWTSCTSAWAYRGYCSCSDHDLYRVRRKGLGCPEPTGSHIVGRPRGGFSKKECIALINCVQFHKSITCVYQLLYSMQ